MTILLQIACCVRRCKNFENRSMFGEAIDKTLVSRFLTHGVYVYSPRSTKVEAAQ